MPTALDHFISRVVGDVVVFVLLEQVVGAHAIAVIQQTLSSKVPTFSINFVLAFLKKGKTSKSHVLFEMNCGTLEKDVHQFVRIPSHRISPIRYLKIS